MARSTHSTIAVSDLPTLGAEVVREARSTGRAVVLTEEGQGVAVLLSMESFEEKDAPSRSALRQAVEEAEQDIELGRWVEHDEVAAQLKRWADGG